MYCCVNLCLDSICTSLKHFEFCNSMSEFQHLTIFHYDGEFEFNLNCPQYKGERQKMRYLSSNITSGELKNIALEASNWKASFEELSIKYILHNGSLFSMLNIDDDNDINGVFKVHRTDPNEILLFVTRRKGEEGGIQHLYHNRLVVLQIFLHDTNL